jgi:hypothetical protein
MRIEFNVTGSDRKALVTAMADILNVKPKYLGVPSLNYEVDYFTVTKDGAVEFDDRADSEEIEQLLESLADKGFVAAPAEMAQAWLDARAEETPKNPPNNHRAKRWGLRWRFPLIRWRSEILRTFWMPRGPYKESLGHSRNTNRNRRGQGFLPLVWRGTGCRRGQGLQPFHCSPL